MNTKTTQISLLTALALFLAACGGDHEEHAHQHESDDQASQSSGGSEEHSHAKEAGPNGGRLITSVDPHAEFLLLPDNRAQLKFIGADGNTLPIESQSAGVVTGDRMNPVILELVINGNALVSEQPLPNKEGQPLVLRIQTAPDADPVIERFNLKTYTCAECDLPEYACICGHD